MIRVERGGEVTYHGPGQLVAYPIIKLADRGILSAAVRPCPGAGHGRHGRRIRCQRSPPRWPARRAGATEDAAQPRKLGALGLRVEGGVTYHGIALNITTNLDDFELIDPCGMPDAQATSIAARGRLVRARFAAQHSVGRPGGRSVRRLTSRDCLAPAGAARRS